MTSSDVQDNLEHPNSPSNPANQNNSDCKNNRIKKLPPLLINQLAAGEVVTRPASVVKELMENAIDAGASQISIRITQGGMGLIEVSDNGCGIHPDDMLMAVTRFATSKIADVAHLQGISTLGFRGEALAATASVSRLTLKSSADSSGIGRELTVVGILDDAPTMTPVVHPQGTTVTVKDLYFNVPARRGNLKSISTEFAHIEAVVKQLALVASDVEINLWHNDKRRFHLSAIPSDLGTSHRRVMYQNNGYSERMQAVITRLKMILPHLLAQTNQFDDDYLQPLTVSLESLVSEQSVNAPSRATHAATAGIGISGLLIPNIVRSSSTMTKLIYINGRLVKDGRIAQSLRQSAHKFEDIEDLGYVLFFELPQAWLNLNVHPSKQSIRIQNLVNISAHLEMAVVDAMHVWHKRFPDIATQMKVHANASETASSTLVASKLTKNDAIPDAVNNTNDTQYGAEANLQSSQYPNQQHSYYSVSDKGMNVDASNNLADNHFKGNHRAVYNDLNSNHRQTNYEQEARQVTENAICYQTLIQPSIRQRLPQLPCCLTMLQASQLEAQNRVLPSMLKQNTVLVLIQTTDNLLLFTEETLLGYLTQDNFDSQYDGVYAHLEDTEKLIWLNNQIEHTVTLEGVNLNERALEIMLEELSQHAFSSLPIIELIASMVNQ